MDVDNNNGIIIPAALIAAREAVEAAEARRKSLREVAGRFSNTAAEAAARAAVLDPEISRLHGELLADYALATTGERMAVADRRHAAAQLAELRAERDKLPQKIADAEAAAAALGPHVAACEAELIAAGRAFLGENMTVSRALDTEFRRDLARLPLPQVFLKWIAISSALGRFGVVGIMNDWRVGLGGPAVFWRGQCRDEAGNLVDLNAAWRDDPELIALAATLAEFAAIDRRVKPLVAAHDERERRRAETERLATKPGRPPGREMQDLGPALKPQPPSGPGVSWNGTV